MRRRVVLWCLALALAAVPQAHAAAPLELRLEADLSGVSLRQAEIIKLLLAAAQIMDNLYQQQLAEGFYPPDMTREEFEVWDDPGARSPFMLVRRDPSGALAAVPYHEAWPRELGRVARLLARAAEITTDQAFSHYLTLRARALITGDYGRSEAAWLAMRDSDLDVMIGPIGHSADREYGLKAAFGSWLLLRDWSWGAQLAQYSVFLPKVQESLPVSEAFRAEVPDVAMKPVVYDLVHRAGYGAFAVADLGPVSAGNRRVELQHGPRSLQLGNVMRARYEALVRPVAGMLIVPGQQSRVSFEPFFLNTLFQEMAHGLGLRETVNGRGAVDEALGEHAAIIEEAKAAVLSLWMASWLYARGELGGAALMDHHVSFLAGLLRGAHGDLDSAAGRARLLLFNYFRDWGAFSHDAASGRFAVNEAGIQQAITAFAGHVLTLQGSGDGEGAAALLENMAVLRPELRDALERLEAAGVAVDVVFTQGEKLHGL